MSQTESENQTGAPAFGKACAPAERPPLRGHGRFHPKKSAGFTLIELIIVVTIIGILAAIAVVQVRNAQRKAQEAALRGNLHEMRKAIDNFYADKQRYPNSLSELVPQYLRAIPPDPITKQVDWQEVQDIPQNPEDEPSSLDSAAQGPGISDVKSTAPGKTLDGVAYTDL